MEVTKKCSKCSQLLSVSQFVKNKRKKGGISSECKTCRRKRDKEYRENGGQYASLRNRNLIDPMARQLHSMVARSKHRAKIKNIPHSISYNYLKSIAPSHCPYFNIPLRWGSFSGQRGASFDSPSLDRINPSLGYVPGNVEIISQRANAIKSDASPHEILAVASRLLEVCSSA